jgi:hypothetical protein
MIAKLDGTLFEEILGLMCVKRREENRRKLVTNPWTCKDKMARFRVFRGERYLMCDEAKDDWPARFFGEDGLFVVDNLQDWEQST